MVLENGGPPIRLPNRIEKTEAALTQLIDFVLSIHALLQEKGYYTHEEVNRMERVMADGRRRLGKSFNIEEGIKAIRAAYRLETTEPK